MRWASAIWSEVISLWEPQHCSGHQHDGCQAQGKGVTGRAAALTAGASSPIRGLGAGSRVRKNHGPKSGRYGAFI